MKQYDSRIENGIKSALFSLDDLMETHHIVDKELESIRTVLQEKVVDAQNGEIIFVN